MVNIPSSDVNFQSQPSQIKKVETKTNGLYNPDGTPNFSVDLKDILGKETQATQDESNNLKNQIVFKNSMKGFNFQFPENDTKLNNFQQAINKKFPQYLVQAKTSVSDVIPDINTMRSVDDKKYYGTKKTIEDIQKKYPNDENIKYILQSWNFVDNATSKIPNKEISKADKEKVLNDIFVAYKVMGNALVSAKDGTLKNDIEAQNKLSQAVIYSGNFVFNAIYLAFGDDLHKQGVVFPSFDLSDMDPTKLDPTLDMFRYLNQTKDGGNDIQGVLALNTYAWNGLVYNVEDLVAKETDKTKKAKLIDLQTYLKNSQVLSIRFQQALLNGGLEIAPLYYPNYFFSTPQDFEKYASGKANQTIKRADIVDPANYGNLGFLEGLYIDEHDYLISKWLKANPTLLPTNVKTQLQNQLNYNDKISKVIKKINDSVASIDTGYTKIGNNLSNFPKLVADLNGNGKLDINNKQFVQFLKNLEKNLITLKFINSTSSKVYDITGDKVYGDSKNISLTSIQNLQKTLDSFNKWKKANPDLAKKI